MSTPKATWFIDRMDGSEPSGPYTRAELRQRLRINPAGRIAGKSGEWIGSEQWAAQDEQRRQELEKDRWMNGIIAVCGASLILVVCYLWWSAHQENKAAEREVRILNETPAERERRLDAEAIARAMKGR